MAERQTTDPGRAIGTGLWANVDRFKAATEISHRPSGGILT